MGDFNPNNHDMLVSVNVHSSLEEIEQVYHKSAENNLSEQHSSNGKDANEMMNKLDEAYEILSKPEERMAYDDQSKAFQEKKRSNRRKDKFTLGTLLGLAFGILALGLLVEAMSRGRRMLKANS